MQQSLVLNSIRFIGLDVLFRVAYFPVWWYTKGLKNILIFIWRKIQSLAASLNLSVLARNLFQPMYGLRDRTSRIISFFVRIVHFFVLFFIEFVWTILVIALAVVWVLFPIFVILNLVFQFGLTDQNLVLTLFL